MKNVGTPLLKAYKHKPILFANVAETCKVLFIVFSSKTQKKNDNFSCLT